MTILVEGMCIKTQVERIGPEKVMIDNRDQGIDQAENDQDNEQVFIDSGFHEEQVGQK